MITLSNLPCPPRDFLLNGGSLAELYSRFHIGVRRHGAYDNLVQLKYSQIESPMAEEVVQCCRGIILDEDNDWAVVAWPFNKFFNHGEALAAVIDWNTARVQEKLDGSLLLMYRYDNGWHVATTGVPDASGAVGCSGMTFAQLFWEAWEKQQFRYPIGLDDCFTFMFELTSPLNRVVVQQHTTLLSFVGMRSIWTGKELATWYRYSYNPVQEFKLTTIADVLATFEKMDALAQEGYVIVDGAFHRVKVKHPGYVALHHLKSSFSMRKVIEVVQRGKAAEVLVHFPEWRGPFEQVQAAYDGLAVHLEQEYDRLKPLASTSRKDFALATKSSPYPATLFQLLDGKYPSARASLGEVHVDKMLDLLGVRDMRLDGTLEADA